MFLAVWRFRGALLAQFAGPRDSFGRLAPCFARCQTTRNRPVMEQVMRSRQFLFLSAMRCAA
ncbi:MAG: hypothetical protein BGO24_15200 [Sphingomonas sp. 67-36]|nr:MAG: hypothetical protein BGO24_15200 [Sphingomonas sp. 67-36]